MAQIPWQYSKSIRRHYIYIPDRDELVFQDGQRVPRPATISQGDLASATFHGDVDLARPSSRANSYTTSTNSTSRRYGHDQESVPRSLRSHVTMSGSTSDVNESLTARMRDARIADEVPSAPYVRSSHNQDELLARTNVTFVKGTRLESTSGTLPSTTITSTESEGYETDRLYPDFKKRRKEFFFVGKVFKILWSEPAGGATTITSREEAIITGSFGEPIYSKVRRFVVIRQGDGYCNALPVTTYGGRGVAKARVLKSEHAIIYTNPLPRPSPAEAPARGELPMRSVAIRVDPDTKAEKLDPMSRVNFGHPHTIQYNVKVKSCGKVAAESIRDLITQFSNVFTTTPSSPPIAPASLSTVAKAVSADDHILKALNTLQSSGMSRPDAAVRLLQALEAKGMTREDALEHIRKVMP